MRYAKEKILTFLYEWDLNCLLCFPVVLLVQVFKFFFNLTNHSSAK